MLETHHSLDVRRAHRSVEPYLLAEPVRRNQFLTTLDRLMSSPEPSGGHYWWSTDGDAVVGVALQAPLGARALLVASSSRAVDSLAATMHRTTPRLTAIAGDAWVAARFAGAWTDLTGGGAEPFDGQRVYELGSLTPAPDTAGSARRASVDDLPTLAEWHLGFCADVGTEPWPDPLETMSSRVVARGIWVWENERLAAMASATRIIAGASRIAHVYTPPEERGKGYGAAVTAATTSDRLAEGAERCLLFTELANPTSNGIYRRLGYQPIEERLTYRFF